MVGLNHKGLIQPKLFYDSMVLNSFPVRMCKDTSVETTVLTDTATVHLKIPISDQTSAHRLLMQ